jgi:PadR family transcriptional regulator, regulatory protein PadR
MIARELIKGTLKYMVLNLLKENQRMYGYEITQVLDETTGGRIKLTFAALYPVLHKLEAEGMVKTETENVNNRIRKYYRLTSKGLKESGIRGDEIREYLQLMTRLFKQ